MAIDILNPNIGLQGVLDPTIEQSNIPQFQLLPSNALTETSLARHFALTNSQQLIDRSLIPVDIDQELLMPEAFKRNLASAYELLKSSRKPELRRFAREDLANIIEDDELYKIYSGLLVGS
ncbi:MAG: hypothetical protein LBE31_00300 [Deltaproteobacteria bacterium]|jgi:hypothetical protein|nr:hypothetical protein [Deltaproteobacteria bacterium]